jgi:methylmalonyl-CoA carboxyltransferase large subunit
MADQNDELLDLVRTLTERVESLEAEIRGIRLLNAQNVPEEVVVAIAAGVAAYMGHRAKKRQAHFTTSRSWQTVTRRSQHQHAPLHLR